MPKYQVYATVPLRFIVKADSKDDAFDRLSYDVDNNLDPSELGLYQNGLIELGTIEELEEDENA